MDGNEKPKFNPNADFVAVAEDKPKFNPNASFEPIDGSKEPPVAEQTPEKVVPQGMAADMAMAVEPKAVKGGFMPANLENTVDATVYKDVNGKAVKQTKDPVNNNFEWSGGKSSQTVKTEAQRISDTDVLKNKQEKQMADVVGVFQKGGGSTTEAKLLTYNNYKAESEKRAKQINSEIESEQPAVIESLQAKAEQRIAANPQYQQLLNGLQEQAKQQFAQLVQSGVPQEQAKEQVQANFAKAYDENPEIDKIKTLENDKINAELKEWQKLKIKGQTKYFQDGLPKLYQDVINSKAFLESTNDDKRQLITQMWGTIEKRMLDSKKSPKVIADAKHDFYYKAMEEASFNEDGLLTPIAIKDYAQANLPQLEKLEKELTDKFNSAKTFDESQAIQKELRDVVGARENFESIINMPDNAHGGFFEGLKDGVSVPFASAFMDAAQGYQVYSIAKKAQNKEPLTEQEQQRLLSEGLLSGAQNQTKPSSAYNIGQSTAASMIFMSELAATSGVNRAAMKGVEKIVMGDALKAASETAVNSARYQLVYKPLAGILGASAQTLANPQMYLKNISERIQPSFSVAYSPEGDKLVAALDWNTKTLTGYNTGKGEDIGTAALRGFGTTFSDIFSESVFRALPSITDPMKRAALQSLTRNSDLAKRTFIGWYMAKEGLTTGGALARMRKGGVPIDGLIPEMLENVVNEGMTNLITGDAPVTNAILKDDGNIDWDKAKENALSTGLVTGVLGLGGKALQAKDSKGSVVITDLNSNKRNAKVSDATISFVVGNLKDKGFYEIKQWAKRNIGRIKPEEREAAMAIINAYAYNAGKNKVFNKGSEADPQWVKDVNKAYEALPKDDNTQAEADFAHTVTQTGNEPVVTVEMPNGDIRIVEDLPTFVVENKDDIANGNIDITIDNATPEMKMVVNAAVNGSEEELQDAMKQYTIEAPKIKTEEVAKSEPIELSVEPIAEKESETKPITSEVVEPVSEAPVSESKVETKEVKNEPTKAAETKVEQGVGKEEPAKESKPIESPTQETNAAQSKVDVTTLKKNDEFYSGGEKFKFIAKEPDGRITVRTSSGSTYTTDAAKFSDATQNLPNAPTTRTVENKGVESNEAKTVGKEVATNESTKNVKQGGEKNIDLSKSKLNYHVSKSPQGVQGEVRFGNGLHGKGFYTSTEKSKVPFSGDSEQFIILTKKPFEENWKNNYRDKGSNDDVRTKALLSEGYDTIKTGDYEIAIGSPKQVVKIDESTTYNDILKKATEYFGNEKDAVDYLKSKDINPIDPTPNVAIDKSIESVGSTPKTNVEQVNLKEDAVKEISKQGSVQAERESGNQSGETAETSSSDSVLGKTPSAEKQAAQERLDKAREAFKKSMRNPQFGGFGATPEFIELVRAYVNAKITDIKLFIADIRELVPSLEATDSEIEDAFNSVKSELSEIIENIPEGTQTKKRSFHEQFEKDKSIPQEIKDAASDETINYKVFPNEVSLDTANKIYDVLGADKAIADLFDDNNGMPMAVRATLGQVIIKRATVEGQANIVRQADEYLSKRGTAYGQFIQALSLFKWMSPEGQVRYAEKNMAEQNAKKAKKAKDDIDKKKDALRKQNEDIVAKVIDGENITAEVNKKSTVNPNPTVPPKYGENNKIVTKKRYNDLKKSLKGKFFANPVAPELVEIGLFHLEAGSRKFADFSKAMVKDLGAGVKKYLKDIYDEASKKLPDAKDISNADEINSELNKDHAQTLAALIVKRLAKKGGKEIDPVKQMINTLLNKVEFKKSEAGKKKSDIEKIGEAIRNKKDYADVWEQSKKEVDSIIEESNLTDEVKAEKKSELQQYFDEIIGQPFSAKQIAGAVKKGLTDLGTDIKEVIRKHYTVYDNAKRTLTEKLIQDAGLSGADAAYLAEQVSKEFNRIAGVEKAKALERLRTVKQKVKKATSKSLEDELIALTNLGAFSDAEFIAKYGEQMGWRSLTDEDISNIKKLAEKVEQEVEGLRRLRAVENLLTYQANLKGVDKADIAQSVWYANILSGYTTHMVNSVANAVNLGLNTAIAISKSPSDYKNISKEIYRGFQRGLLEAKATLKTGYSPIGAKAEVPATLERVVFNPKNPLLKPVYGLNALKYVRRLMVAADVMMFEPAKAMRAYQLAKKMAVEEGKLDPTLNQRQRALEIVGNTKEKTIAAKEQAQQEYEERVAKINADPNYTASEKAEFIKQEKIDIQRRVFEILESGITAENTEVIPKAAEYARRVTYNYKPEGMLGMIAGLINSGTQKVPIAKYLVPFTNIIANVANEQLNYTPIGMARSFTEQGSLSRVFGGGYVKGNEMMDADTRNDMRIKSAIGLVGAATLFMLSQPDDDGESIIEITANGYKDYNKNYDLRNQGWQPYSVRVGKNWYSYQYTPLALMFSLIGNVRDAEKYRGEKLRDTMLTKFGVAATESIRTFFDSTYLASVDTFLSTIFDSQNENILDDAMKGLMKTLNSFVMPNMYTQLAKKVEESFDIPTKDMGDKYYAQILKDVPVARDLIFEDKVNGLGEEVIPDTDKFVSEVKDETTSDKIWQLLAEKKTTIPVQSYNAFNGRGIYDPKVGDVRVVTTKEYHDYLVNKGTIIKDYIKENYDNLSKLSDEEFKKEIQDISLEAGKIAKAKMMFKSKAVEYILNKGVPIEPFKPTTVKGVSGVTIQGTHIRLTKEQVMAIDAQMEKILTGLIEKASVKEIDKTKIDKDGEEVDVTETWPVLSKIKDKELLQEQISQMRTFAKGKAVKNVLKLKERDYEKFEEKKEKEAELKATKLENAR